MQIVTHVLTSPQTLDNARQKIARQNIGAVAGAKVGETPVSTDSDGFIVLPDASLQGKGVVKLVDSIDTEERFVAVTPKAVQDAMAQVGGYKVVDAGPDGKPNVPLEDRSPNYIYLTEDPDAQGEDHYNEWIWDLGDPSADPPVAASWTLIGTTSPDLRDYVHKVSGGTPGNVATLTNDGSIADSDIAGTAVADAVAKKHSHSNQDTLDDITAAYTTEEQTKLSGIAEGAQVNTIESISVSGTAVTPDANKNVNIVIPKAVPDPTAPNQMLFSVDGANWAPVTWEMELFDAVRVGDKIYDTVKIGDQVWLAENLDFLPEGITLHNESPTTADFSTAGAWYCNNDKSTAQSRGYGLLYNTIAVDYLEANKATLFPGWHVPTEADMNAFVGNGTSARRNSMRKAVDWAGSSWDNGAATNSTGFSAIPCGDITNGTPPYYNAEGSGMEMWSCTVNDAGNRYFVPIGGSWTFYVNTHGNSAYFCGSVRLVKDSV